MKLKEFLEVSYTNFVKYGVMNIEGFSFNIFTLELYECGAVSNIVVNGGINVLRSFLNLSKVTDLPLFDENVAIKKSPKNLSVLLRVGDVLTLTLQELIDSIEFSDDFVYFKDFEVSNIAFKKDNKIIYESEPHILNFLTHIVSDAVLFSAYMKGNHLVLEIV